MPIIIPDLPAPAQVDLARVLGTVLSNTNPILIEPNLQNWMRSGQMFTAALPPTATGNQTSGLSIFNASSAKNALIFAIQILDTGAGQSSLIQAFKTTSDPALGASATPVNNNFNSGVSSSMTCSRANSGVSISGTFLHASDTNNNNPSVLLPPGVCYLLPANASTGLAVSAVQANTGGNVAISIVWVEY